MYLVSAAILLKLGFAGNQVDLGVFGIAWNYFARCRMKNSLNLLPQAGGVLQLSVVDPLIRLLPGFKGQRIAVLTSGENEILSHARVGHPRLKNKTGGFHGPDSGLLLLGKVIYHGLLFQYPLCFLCLQLHLEVHPFFPCVNVFLCRFIREIAVDPQIHFRLQIIDCGSVVGKAIRLHGAIQIFLGDDCRFFQRRIVQLFIKAILKGVVNNHLITGSSAPWITDNFCIFHQRVMAGVQITLKRGAVNNRRWILRHIDDGKPDLIFGNLRNVHDIRGRIIRVNLGNPVTDTIDIPQRS